MLPRSILKLKHEWTNHCLKDELWHFLLSLSSNSYPLSLFKSCLCFGAYPSSWTCHNPNLFGCPTPLFVGYWVLFCRVVSFWHLAVKLRHSDKDGYMNENDPDPENRTVKKCLKELKVTIYINNVYLFSEKKVGDRQRLRSFYLI